MHSFFNYLIIQKMTTTTDSTDTNTDLENTELSQEELAAKAELEKANEVKAEENKATPQELKSREIVKANQKKIDEGQIDHKDLAPWIQEQTTPKKADPSKEESDKEQLKKELKEEMKYEDIIKAMPKITEDQGKVIDEIMGSEKFKTLSKLERIEYAKHKAGVSTKSEVDTFNKGKQEGLEIGRFQLLGSSNHDSKKKAETEDEKTEQKYMDNLPDFAKK